LSENCKAAWLYLMPTPAAAVAIDAAAVAIDATAIAAVRPRAFCCSLSI